MKSFVFILSALALTFGASAQLRVYSNGHIRLGDWDAGLGQAVKTPALSSDDLIISPTLPGSQGNDTTTTISVVGSFPLNYSGGSIAFGSRKDVMIEEKKFTPSVTAPYGVLSLTGLGGVNYEAANGTVFSFTPPRASTSAGGI